MCIKTYAARTIKRPWQKKEAPVKNSTPPCHKCRPVLLPDNELAVSIYNNCADQWRFCRETGRLVIDNTNILAAMEYVAMGADLRQNIFETVKFIISEISALVNVETDQPQEQDNRPKTWRNSR